MKKQKFISLLKATDTVALKTEQSELTYQNLISRVSHLADFISSLGCERIGLYGDNCIDWLVADLAALEAEVTLVPIPMFFSDDQIRKSVEQSQLDVVINIDDDRLLSLLPLLDMDTHQEYHILFLRRDKAEPLANIRKITYTSGSTGEPKGACLDERSMVAVASSLASIVPSEEGETHLCLLPLSTLLENVAGVYASLLNGMTIVVPPQEGVGLNGSSTLNIEQMYSSLYTHKANTAIMTPQLLQALVFYMESNQLDLPELKFLAVGGGNLSVTILDRSEKLGLPVFEGYGLSEACSVVCCNEPNNYKKGSIGKPLPHVNLKIEDDGEILVSGSTFKGYLNLDEGTNDEGFWPTGDLGSVDDDGFVFIAGRKKNLLISSFGRNVAPEWVEAELTTKQSVLQAAVFGDGEAYLSAIVFSLDTSLALKDIAKVNLTLPDYAQVKKVIFSDEPFSKENRLLTENGRIKRINIAEKFNHELASIYDAALDKDVSYEV